MPLDTPTISIIKQVKLIIDAQVPHTHIWQLMNLWLTERSQTMHASMDYGREINLLYFMEKSFSSNHTQLDSVRGDCRSDTVMLCDEQILLIIKHI